MAARSSSRFSKIVAFWIFTLVIVVSVARSQQSVSVECVRICRPRQLKRLTRKVSKLFSSCYQQCLGVKKATHQQAPVRKGTFQKRFRKAIPTDPSILDCPYYSPNQTQDWTPSKTNVTFGQYENTGHWFAKISWTPMNDANESWTSVQIVFYAGTAGVGDMNCLTYPKNQSVATVNISSYGYQYPNDIYLRIIGRPFSSKDYSADLGTYGPVEEVPQTVPTPGTDTGPSDYATSITVTVSLVGLLVGLLLVGCLIYIIRRKKMSHKLPPEFKYHAFIIYSRENESWVTRELLPFLEKESRLKCCIHYRDFIPGISYEENMANSVYNSYKVISVFSKDFVLSNYCIHELKIAKYRLLKERDDSLVIIRIDKTDCKKLPRDINKRSFIDYANPLERPFWKRRLLKFLDTPKDLDKECSEEEDKDNNNSFPNESIQENKPKRTPYERTISTATEVSVISETEVASV